MSTSAVVRVTQFLPDSADGHVRDHAIDNSCDVAVYDISGSIDGTYTYKHLEAIQNPTPAVGRSGYRTQDSDRWSDSPTVQPSLNDRYRYAYGRYGSRYRNLDDYSGVVIHQRDFSGSGEFSVIEKGFNGDGYIRNMPPEVNGSMQIQEHDRIAGETTINQYDLIVSASPVPYSYKNPVDTDVWIKLSNYVSPLSSGTTTLRLDGELKTTLDIVPFYTGLGGFTATWSNDEYFNYDSQVSVEWRVFDEDTPANEFIFKYWFRTVKDYVGPRVVNILPADDSTDISVSSCVSFDLRDYETGVNINTLELYINNILIQQSELTIAELSTLDGYHVVYCPQDDFLNGDVVAVSIYVEDMAAEPNYLFHVFSFTTVSSVPPIVIDSNPVSCREYIPSRVDVSVSVVDGGDGIDEGTIEVAVDDNVVSHERVPIIYRED